MADAEKPYRLYKGGRTKGKVPTAPRPERAGRGEPSRAKQPGKPRWGRRIGLAVLLLGVLLVVWIVASYLSFRQGVEQANERLPKTVAASLAAQDGLLTSKPSLIMLLGTDGDKTAARQDFRRSDSILLVRTDPERHRMAYLSIPRDLRVDIPGQGPNKINAAFQLGGPALTMKTVRALTGLQPNHVVLVDFDNFKDVIDALGGVEIDVPKPILSNRFDCPYATEARCQEWQGWRFEKGTQTMDGKRALIYSRVRENRLDPAENDLTRGERQQDVVEAMTNELVVLRHLPQAPVHRRRPRRAADDGSLRRAAAAARLVAVPLERGSLAPLPPRRRAAVDRRRVRARRRRGEQRHALDVHRPVGAAAAAAGNDLRRRLPGRPRAVRAAVACSGAKRPFRGLGAKRDPLPRIPFPIAPAD